MSEVVWNEIYLWYVVTFSAHCQLISKEKYYDMLLSRLDNQIVLLTLIFLILLILYWWYYIIK